MVVVRDEVYRRASATREPHTGPERTRRDTCLKEPSQLYFVMSVFNHLKSRLSLGRPRSVRVALAVRGVNFKLLLLPGIRVRPARCRRRALHIPGARGSGPVSSALTASGDTTITLHSTAVIYFRQPADSDLCLTVSNGHPLPPFLRILATFCENYSAICHDYAYRVLPIAWFTHASPRCAT